MELAGRKRNRTHCSIHVITSLSRSHQCSTSCSSSFIFVTYKCMDLDIHYSALFNAICTALVLSDAHKNEAHMSVRSVNKKESM